MNIYEIKETLKSFKESDYDDQSIIFAHGDGEETELVAFASEECALNIVKHILKEYRAIAPHVAKHSL